MLWSNMCGADDLRPHHVPHAPNSLVFLRPQSTSCPIPPSFSVISKHYLSLEELLTKLLLFTAEEATDKALGLAPPTNRNNTTNNNNHNTYSTSQTVVAASAKDEFSREGISAGGEGGGMFDFRRKASRALRAARSIAEQHGLDVRFVESLLVRLAKAWINQPKAAGGGGPGGGGAAAGLFAGGSAGGMVLGGAESVFARDAREVGWFVFESECSMSPEPSVVVS